MLTTNAITRRLDVLQKLWEDFRATPQYRVCRFGVRQDELTMIDAFVQLNAEENSDVPDLFLRFETPFTDAASYGRALSDELQTMVDDINDAQWDEVGLVQWQSNHHDNSENVAVGFLKNFFRLADELALEEDYLVVAFLAPIAIERPQEWSKWWAAAATLNLPPRIRLMVTDTEGSEYLTKMATENPTTVQTIRPQLNMSDAIRELMTEYGDQDDNCTHFRKAFFELTQVVGTRDAQQIQSRAKHALQLARAIDFAHLEIAVLCTAGLGFNTAGKPQLALTAFDEATKIAKSSEHKPLLKEMPDLKVELPGGNLFQQLGVQILFFKAAGFLSQSPPQYAEALTAYQQAETQLLAMIQAKGDPEKADWMNGGILVLHRIEALRMCGFCLEKLQRYQDALTIYARAVPLAEQFDAETRKTTTLAYIGQSMLDLCKKMMLKDTYVKVQARMEHLLGKNWQNSLAQAA